MGDLYVAPREHRCRPPGAERWSSIFTPADRPAGSVWQCDECFEIWRALHTLIGPQWGRADAETRARFDPAGAARAGGGE